MPPETLRWALRYARRGWFVIPLYGVVEGGVCTCEEGERCRSPGKHPMISDWENRAEDRPEIIQAWWRRWPEANVGLAVGASGLLVLDVDGEEGMGSLSLMEDECGPLPPTLRFQTGGGGIHFVFSKGELSIGNRRGLYPKLDVRADGGLIVAPPSLHASGQRYTLLPGPVEPAPVPAWLVEMSLFKPSEGERQRKRRPVRGAAFGQRAERRHVQEAVPPPRVLIPPPPTPPEAPLPPLRREDALPPWPFGEELESGSSSPEVASASEPPFASEPEEESRLFASEDRTAPDEITEATEVSAASSSSAGAARPSRFVVPKGGLGLDAKALYLGWLEYAWRKA